MSQEQYSTRLGPKERRKIERYRDEHNISKAEALREGVRELERQNTGSNDGSVSVDLLRVVIRNWGAVMVAGIGFLLLSSAGLLPDLVTVLAGVGLLLTLPVAWYVS